MIEEDREQPQPVPSPTRSNSRVPWSKPTWPNPGNPSYLSDHLPKTDYRGVPPLHELSREHHSSSTPSSESTVHRSYLPPNVASPQTHSAQAAAQLALQHTSSLRPAPHRMERTEKEKMLAGELYRPFNPILLEERERCKAAVWRFNNSTNPNLGVSREERARLFREILQPSSHNSHHSGGSGTGTPGSISSVSPVGSVGERVVVEAPFTCDYGYNISIGDDVLISANCTITDTCSVRIGSRCVIGPNVNFQGGTLPIDPAKRKGSQGPAMGNAITIEDDCWIGCRAIIMPGVTIGRCSTVAAGSVVTKVGLTDKLISRNTSLLTLISEYGRFHRLSWQSGRTDTRRRARVNPTNITLHIPVQPLYSSTPSFRSKTCPSVSPLLDIRFCYPPHLRLSASLSHYKPPRTGVCWTKPFQAQYTGVFCSVMLHYYLHIRL